MSTEDTRKKKSDEGQNDSLPSGWEKRLSRNSSF